MTKEQMELEKGHLASQRLAMKGIREVAKLVGEGFSEKDCARMLDSWFRDHGIKSYFHGPFAWIGERCRFSGMKRYRDFLPTDRVLRAGEVFILDVAPIYKGYQSDVGLTFCLGENEDFEKAMCYLEEVRKNIPKLFSSQNGSEIYAAIEEDFSKHGYDNIHQLYPFGVLGHKMHRSPEVLGRLKILRFGWQSFYSLLVRGLVGQILTRGYKGSLEGVWAIEPHIGGVGFGAKFEEFLVVEEGRAFWLEDKWSKEKNVF